METYICIGKCVPTPASHSRALPLPTGPLSLAVYPPLCHPVHPRALSAFRTGPSFLSFPLAMLTLVALTIPRSLFQPLSPSLAPSRFLPRRASAAPFALFFPSCLLFFSSSTPPSRRVIFIICYLLRHTPLAVAAAVAANRRVSGAAHPEKPENRGKQKRPARRAAHPAGWARSNGSGGNGRGDGDPYRGRAAESSPGERRGGGGGGR